jgi:hypothetical protein
METCFTRNVGKIMIMSQTRLLAVILLTGSLATTKFESASVLVAAAKPVISTPAIHSTFSTLATGIQSIVFSPSVSAGLFVLANVFAIQCIAWLYRSELNPKQFFVRAFNELKRNPPMYPFVFITSQILYHLPAMIRAGFRGVFAGAQFARTHKLAAGFIAAFAAASIGILTWRAWHRRRHPSGNASNEDQQ